MRYDRTGEPLDPEPTRQPHRCDDGWITRDTDHPQPCYHCKPHLAPQRRRDALNLGTRPTPGDWRKGSAAVRAALDAARQNRTRPEEPTP